MGQLTAEHTLELWGREERGQGGGRAGRRAGREEDEQGHCAESSPCWTPSRPQSGASAASPATAGTSPAPPASPVPAVARRPLQARRVRAGPPVGSLCGSHLRTSTPGAQGHSSRPPARGRVAPTGPLCSLVVRVGEGAYPWGRRAGCHRAGSPGAACGQGPERLTSPGPSKPSAPQSPTAPPRTSPQAPHASRPFRSVPARDEGKGGHVAANGPESGQDLWRGRCSAGRGGPARPARVLARRRAGGHPPGQRA